MKAFHALGLQAPALLDRDRGRDHAPCLRVVVEALELGAEPGRHLCSAKRGEPLRLGEIADGQDPRNDLAVDPGLAAPVPEPEKAVGLEEELRDRARRAGVQLALQIVDFERRVRRIGMALRIGGDADFEIVQAAQTGDKVQSIGIAAGMRPVALADAGRRVACQ